MSKLKLHPVNGGNVAKDDDLRNFKAASEWKFCKLSNKRLRLPIVSDYKGHLFNKEAILEWLLTPGREDYSQDQISNFAHIRRLDDVVELRNLKEIESAETKDRAKESRSIVCEYGEGTFGKCSIKFVYIVNCGDVLPVSSLQMVNQKTCPKCGVSYKDLDVIILNPSSSDEIQKLADRHKELMVSNKHHNGKEKRLKRARKPNNKSSSRIESKSKKVKYGVLK